MACFNPRAREGRDLNPKCAVSIANSFNPRAREGRDMIVISLLSTPLVSTHAPAKGATGGS